MSDPLARRRLGKYEILRRLAIGGMGEIFLARDQGDRIVVIKLLIDELAEDPQLVRLFIDEAAILSHLHHPNIVEIHDFGEKDGLYFIAMEYIAGQNLARLEAKGQSEGDKIPLLLSVQVMAELTLALECVHSAKDADGVHLGLVHRDVSPSNILVSRRGEVKLMDFGIAKASNQLLRTATGVLRGKIGYMAPEQIQGRATPSIDIFAAGIILWELTVHRRLFQGDNELETIELVMNKPIPRPSSIDPDYPRELEEIVMSALERDPTRRPTAAELHRSLRSYLDGHVASSDDPSLAEWVCKLFPESADLVVEPSPPHSQTESLPGFVRAQANRVEAPQARIGARRALLVILAAASLTLLWVRWPRAVEESRPLIVSTPSIVSTGVPVASPAPQKPVPPVQIASDPAPRPVRKPKSKNTFKGEPAHHEAPIAQPVEAKRDGIWLPVVSDK